MKKVCLVCGSEVDDVSGVCPVCGASLTTGDFATSAGDAGTPNQAPGNGMPNQAPGYGTPNQAPGYGTPNQAPGYGAPNQPVYQSYNGQPYNYQNPSSGGPIQKQGFVFGLISLLCSIAALLTICVPWLPVILGIAAVIFAIVALVKKQKKGLAVAGMVIGIIALLIGFMSTFMNWAFKVASNVSMGGFINQMVEAVNEGSRSVAGISFDYEGTTYTFYTDDSFVTNQGLTGGYECSGYADTESQSILVPTIIYALSQNHKVAEVVLVTLSDGEKLVVCIPDDFQVGDTIYIITGDLDSQTERDIEAVPTRGVSN